MIVLILALGFRLIGIGSRPIWYDEAFSILISEQGPSAILAGTVSADVDASAAEEHPPAYYFMLWGWMQVFGTSPIAARALSILASLSIVTITYLIADHLFDPSLASTAGLFTAILPFQVHHAQEIRMYVFLALWLSLATYAFLKRRWIIFAVSAALAQYTHNLAAIYLIPLALIPIFQRDWKTLRALTLAGFAAIVLYSPWLVQLPAQFSKIHSNFWIDRPGVERLFTLLLSFIPNLPLSDIWLIFGLSFAVLIFALAVYQTYLAAKLKFPETDHGLWLAYLSFAPPIILWLVSQYVPVYVERALLPSHVIFCIWLAWALTKTHLPRPVQLSSFVLVFAASAIGLYQHVTYDGFPYGHHNELNKSLRDRVQPGDVIIHSSKLSYLPAFYFDHELSQSFIADPTGSNTDTLSPATIQVLSLNAVEDVESATAIAARIWFVIFQQSIDEFSGQANTHPHLKYLEENFNLEFIEEWDDLRLYLFTR
jgi:uncharacterized membrane protein